MSVINQMLQDLEARAPADAQAGPAMHAGTRAAAAPARPVRVLPWLLTALLALGLAGVLWTGWQLVQSRGMLPGVASPQVVSPVASAAPSNTSDEALGLWNPPLQMSLHLSPLTPSELGIAAPAPAGTQAPTAAAPGPGGYPAASPAASPVNPAVNPAMNPAMNPAVNSSVNPAANPSAKPSANPSANQADPSASRRDQAATRDASDPRAQSRPDAVKPSDPTPRQQAEAESLRGVALARAGRLLDAIDAFDRSLMLDRSYIVARLNLANALVEVKRVDEAMARLQEGLNENRASAALAMRLALIQIDRGESRAAIDTLARSLPYDRERADYQAFMAGLLQKEGRHAEAIDYYLTALRRTPQNATWWMGLGQSLQAEKRVAEAREALQRAQSLGGLSPEQQANLQQRLEQMR